jgi:MFS family permease
MPRAAWVLFLGQFVNRLGTFVLPFMVLYLHSRGESPAVAGLALSAYGVGAVGAQIAGGLLTDRLGRRTTLSVSMLTAAGLTLSLLAADSLGAIIALMVLLGCAAEMYRPAATALITDVVPPERLVAAYALNRLTFNVGWAVGLALGGLLADRSFQLLFWGDALTSATFGLIALTLPHGVRTSRAEESALGGGLVAALRTDRAFLLFLGATFLGGFIYLQNLSTFALHVRDAGFSNAVYGALQGLNGAIVAVLELPIAALTQHRDRMRVAALSIVMVGFAFGSLSFVDTLPLLVAMVFLWTVGEIVGSPVISAFVSERSPEHLRGRYQAAFGMMWALAGITSPLVGGAVYDASPDLLWAGCAVLSVVAAGLALGAGRLARGRVSTSAS